LFVLNYITPDQSQVIFTYSCAFREIGIDAKGGQKIDNKLNPKLNRNFSPEVNAHLEEYPKAVTTIISHNAMMIAIIA
jgi:hypothetical protein